MRLMQCHSGLTPLESPHSLKDDDRLLGQFEQGADNEFVGDGLEAKLDLYAFYLEREGQIRMAARTEWPDQEEADYTRKIWVRVSPDIEADLLATVKLNVDKLSDNPQYNPPGFGEFKQSDTDPFEWAYTAFAEPRLEKNAMTKKIFPILSAGGKSLLKHEEEVPLLIVMPCFDFLAYWKSIPFDKPQAREAYEFIWWRYGDLFDVIPAADPVIQGGFYGSGSGPEYIPDRRRTVGFSDYDFDLTHNADRGITNIDNSVVFGFPAFAQGENSFAMTVAHELFHTGQSSERRIAANIRAMAGGKNFVECEVYRYLLLVFRDYGVYASDQYYIHIIIPSLMDYCGLVFPDEEER